jgi:hypothetical protein
MLVLASSAPPMVGGALANHPDGVMCARAASSMMARSPTSRRPQKAKILNT